ncbi:MAG: transposase [Thermoguttaceae bacterium]
MLDRYSEAQKVILVCDNLNTHGYGSFYERYSPDEALSICQRLEIRYTPKYGSWLNIAECELSVLTRRCLKIQRYPTIEALSTALDLWTLERNTRQEGVSWQFTTTDARIKLKALCPHVEL